MASLLVWGIGAAQVPVVRNSDSCIEYIDNEIATSLIRAGADVKRDEESQGWIVQGDAWCIALDPSCVDLCDLDRDAAVVGYKEFA